MSLFWRVCLINGAVFAAGTAILAASPATVSAPVLATVAMVLTARRGERLPGSILSARESAIVKLIAEGRSSKEIAALLVISVKTVERHRANILQKLEMRDRTELTRYALRTGLIES